VIHQVETRHLDCAHGCKSVRQFLRLVLRISPGEASARVRAAGAMGPRQATSGEPLEPIYPTVAAAHAEGAISPQHASTWIDPHKNPDEIACTTTSRGSDERGKDFSQRGIDPHRCQLIAACRALVHDRD
jgi:hypothetical protein